MSGDVKGRYGSAGRRRPMTASARLLLDQPRLRKKKKNQVGGTAVAVGLSSGGGCDGSGSPVWPRRMGLSLNVAGDSDGS